MQQRLVIVGGGFAGMYAALSAARLRSIQNVSPSEFEIVLVSPRPDLVIRPRLYEPNPEKMKASLLEVFGATDIRYLQGTVERINTDEASLSIVSSGDHHTLTYDRLVLAAGSQLFRPDIPGLAKHGFSVDTIDDAITLDRHLHSLADSTSPERGTVVVAGGGFTGIEVATEMPSRLRAILGEHAPIRVVIVQRGDAIAPDMGPNPRHVIEEALRKVGVETKLGSGVAALDGTGITLDNGEHIKCATAIWAAGIRANPLTAQIPGERDSLGRLLVDVNLRVPKVPHVFATGDTAKVPCDNVGNYALMSCQHSTRLGAFAGNNAAAEILGVQTLPYHQESYVTCLDLGTAGAVFTRGWERNVELIGEKAKNLKREINTVWIYPPRAEREAALASAEPENVTKV